MRIGLVLMNAGAVVEQHELARVAREADAVGYASLWVTESEPFPVTGGAAGARQTSVGPLDALAVAAVQTSVIRLGVSLPNTPFQSPIAVGQNVAALDVLSNGRVTVGRGLDWTADDARLVDSALSRPETPAAEFLRVVKAVWGGAEVQVNGDHYVIPRSNLGVPPIQRPHPVVELLAFAPAAVQRPAEMPRGGSPLAPSLPAETQTGALRQISRAAVVRSGAFPAAMRAIVEPSPLALGPGRALFSGSWDEIGGDIAFAESLGVREVVVDLSRAVGLQSAAAFERLGAPRGLGTARAGLAQRPAAYVTAG